MAESDRTGAKKDEPEELASAWFEHVRSVLKSRDFAIEQMKENREEAARLDAQHMEMAIRTGYILKEIQNSVTVYSQLMCRPFCTQIAKVLPRELRNHIYGYLLGPRPDDPVPRTTLIKRRRREIWFSESWVGRQFTIEICEMAYRTDNLQLCGSCNLADLLLLPEDNGVRPVAHIRSLVLRMDLTHRRCVNRCCYDRAFPPPPPPMVPPPFPLEDLAEDLQSLQKIERKPGFKLELRLCGYYVVSHFMDAMDAIKAVLMQLKDDGMEITVRQELYYNPTNRYPADVMAYYDQPREEWEEVCRQHRARLKSEGVVLQPSSPPLPPPPGLQHMHLPLPPPIPWNPPPAVTVANPPMAAISIVPPVGNAVVPVGNGAQSDEGSEPGEVEEDAEEEES